MKSILLLERGVKPSNVEGPDLLGGSRMFREIAGKCAIASALAAALVCAGCETATFAPTRSQRPPIQTRTCPDGSVVPASISCRVTPTNDQGGDGGGGDEGGGGEAGEMPEGPDGSDAVSTSHHHPHLHARKKHSAPSYLHATVRTGREPTAATEIATETSYSDTQMKPNAEIEAGKGAFVQPPPMVVSGWYPIEFVAGPDQATLASQSEGAPLTQPTAIFVSQNMRVTLLSDPSFEIRPKSRSLQATGHDKASTWLWDVSPHAGGRHLLFAKVEVLTKKPDGSLELYQGYTRQVAVMVKVTAWQKTMSSLSGAKSLGDALTAVFGSWKLTLGALAGLILALVGVIAAVRRLKRA